MSGLPPQERSWDELLGPDRAAPGELLGDMRHPLGLDPARAERLPDGPDVSGLAEEIGLS